jgi:hypothetical protein
VEIGEVVVVNNVNAGGKCLQSFIRSRSDGMDTVGAVEEDS